MTIIVLLILTGLLLLFLEFFIIPGITIAGIGGLLFIGGGVYMTYSTYGATVGSITLIGTIIAPLIIAFIAYKNGMWDRLILKTELTENVNSTDEKNIQIGDKGITITRLNPMGRVRVNDIDIEGRCPDNFLDPQVEIEVVKVTRTYIIVKPLNE